MVVAAAAPLVLLASALPRPLVLPTVCLIAVAGAALASLLAWSGAAVRSTQRVTAWDVAGALAYVGFAAGMLSDPQHLIQFFDDNTTASLTK